MRFRSRLFAAGCAGAGLLVVSASTVRAESLSIRGTAVFRGNAAEFAPKLIEAVEGTECQLGPALKTENVIINNTDPLTLSNVVVSIKSGPIDFRTPRPMDGTTLRVKNCRFEPHILALEESQKLTIRNEDPFKHRLQTESTKNPPRSFSLPRPDMHMQMSFQEEQEPFKIVSRGYPWMRAWCVVFKHPYFAITGADGAFEFTEFPPGRYELTAWHEEFGSQAKTVDIQPGQPNTVEFVFEPKKKDE